VFKKIFRLLTLLNPEQKKGIVLIQGMIFLLSCVEIVSVAAVVPLIAMISDPSLVQSNSTLKWLYGAFTFQDNNQFFIFVGALVLFAILISSLTGILATALITRFSFQLGRHFSSYLFAHFMEKDYLFHTRHNSAFLINKVSKQVDRVTMGLILPFLQINSRLFLVLCMVIGLVMVDPVLILSTAVLLTGIYFLIFTGTRKILALNGKAISRASEATLRALNEGFGGVKEIKFLGKEMTYIQQYDRAANDYAQAATVSQVVPIIPRYLLDVIAFGGLITVILYYLSMGRSLNSILPVLSLFAVTGIKVLPAFQQIFANISNIKSNIDALDSIENDLTEYFQSKSSSHRRQPRVFPKPEKQIELRNLSFRYPEKNRNAIDDLSLQIKVNSSVAFVGRSGSGKTTLVDLILGLITPLQGQILVDGATLSSENMRQWQDQIGYVPQTVYLSDASIKCNIALGTPPEEIDFEKVKAACQMAELDQYIESLPQNYETSVGERGVQLSGGQRQRIGIARALYHGASILVLDEATSALDGLTESSIINSIHGLMGKKTILIIAHRLSTVQECDQLILMEEGKIKDIGTYNELLKTSSDFQQMAKLNLQR
jgi:HlyD family secretion protein